MLVVDAANVVGSRPTGWWRDRAGAARRLVETVAASGLPPPVVVVLEGAARDGAAEGEVGDATVVHAPGAADETIVALAGASDEPVTVVTADRALAERCRAAGARVVGPSWLLERLPD